MFIESGVHGISEDYTKGKRCLKIELRVVGSELCPALNPKVNVLLCKHSLSYWTNVPVSGFVVLLLDHMIIPCSRYMAYY